MALRGRTGRLLLLGLLLAISLGSRWIYIRETRIPNPIRADARQYATLAYNLAYQGVYSERPFPQSRSHRNKWPPGYPFFLAPIARLASSPDDFYRMTQAVQAFLGSLVPPAVCLAAAAFLPWPWALSAALVAALSPHLIAGSAFVLTETLFSVVLAFSVLAVLHLPRRTVSWYWATAGFLTGLAVLVRPVIILFAPLAVYVAVREGRRRGDRPFGRLAAVFLLAGYLLFGAWTVWNRTVPEGRPGDFREILHQVLVGAYPDLIHRDPRMQGMPYREDPRYEEVMKRGVAGVARELWRRVRERPARQISWYLRKPFFLWSGHVLFGDGINYYMPAVSGFETNPFLGGLRRLGLWLHPLVVGLAFLSPAVYFGFRRAGGSSGTSFPLLVLWMLLGHYSLLFVVLTPMPRYGVPLFPPLYVLAASTLFLLARLPSLRRRREQKPEAGKGTGEG